MIEVKLNALNWWDPSSRIVPTAGLTVADQKKLKERDEFLDKLHVESKRSEHWVKLNRGLFRGSIFRTTHQESWHVNATVYDNASELCLKGENIHSYTRHVKEPSKVFDFAERCCFVFHGGGRKPIKLKDGVLYPEFFSTEVIRTASLLLEYDGDEVYQMDEKRRPLTFKDRLDQDVTIGDLVVVALNYGAGLDICVVKGFADERRVVIESVETGINDRIPLEKNATAKIMRMPNSLKDTALLMKLGR